MVVLISRYTSGQRFPITASACVASALVRYAKLTYACMYVVRVVCMSVTTLRPSVIQYNLKGSRLPVRRKILNRGARVFK